MAYPPVEPIQLHSSLMDALHGMLGHRGLRADHKASYAGILATLAKQQAKMHQEAAPGRAGPGGAQQPEESGYPVGQVQALPPQYGGYGALAGAAHPAMTALQGQPQGLALAQQLGQSPVLQALQAVQQRQAYNPILAVMRQRGF